MDAMDSSGIPPMLTPLERPLSPAEIKERGAQGNPPQDFHRRRAGPSSPGSEEKEAEASDGTEHLIDIII